MRRAPRPLFVVVACAVALLGACGRARQRNVPDGEARTLRAAAPAGEAAAESREAAVPVTAEEARRRATVRRLGEAYAKARTPEDRADLLEKIGQLGPGGADLAPTLDVAAADPSPLVRAFAVRARAAVGGAGLAARVQEALKDAAEEVRMAAAEAVGSLPAPNNWASAVDAARRERSARVQEALIAAVEKDVSPDAAAALVGLLRGQSSPDAAPLANAAAKTLVRALLKQPKAAADGVDLVAAFVRRDDPELRAVAARALGAFDARTAAAKSALVFGLTDPVPAVRVAAFDVLKAWSGQSFGYDPAADESARREGVRSFGRWAEGAK